MISLRLRTTLLAASVVGLTLLAAGYALVLVQRRSLTDNIDQAIMLRAGDIAALVEAGDLPPALTVWDADVSLVQVVDGEGNVVAASPNVAGLPRLHDARPAPGQTAIARVDRLPVNDEAFRMLARTVEGPGGPRTIYVAGSLEPVGDAAETLQATLALVIPALLVLVAAGTWVTVGHTLRPVEAIRAEVAEISGRDLARRVPEPSTRDEIGRLARTMNAMLQRLEDAYERQQHFVADASHELRSPLATIRAELEVDLANAPAADWPATAGNVLAEVERLQQMAEDLLFLARSDAAAAGRQDVPLDLDDIVLREAEAVRPRGRARVDTSAVSAGQVRGDPGQLARVVRNLLDNAERHASSTVSVRLREDGASVVLEVLDDGPGVAGEDTERIFERFTRADAARTRAAGGAGLGLAIARAIVQDHGGTIALDRDHRPGARFVVTLPAHGR